MTGKVCVVTGANAGLGKEIATQLAKKGGTVIMACRNLNKAKEAEADISKDAPQAKVEVMQLDVASLESVANFTAAFSAKYDRLDVLVNNAGIMAIYPRQETPDGFEMQLGINYLGAWALTGRLLDMLIKTEGSRVVNQSSFAAFNATVFLDDLQMSNKDGRSKYGKFLGRWAAYGQSKLAQICHMTELSRRLAAAGHAHPKCFSAHPGYVYTNLQATAGNQAGALLAGTFFKIADSTIGQKVDMGALPVLYAISEESLQGGELIGPDGLLSTAGYPAVVTVPSQALDDDTNAKLWEASEQLTKVTYDFGKRGDGSVSGA
ncbi:unnamed protein product [Vitrella brassicaformis CCMP3155]|uniref:Uncharacterized protein n=2 Tax=Vitrella brassicaformis TaxID=1169539 RepID=A0A0G4ETY1_VITBC|nr:unnamed protein product [Vitrella brassicaformis CCMP3155]|eukprot:CEM01782.1 unnamed protein product [Vitrella brassicaformis CCMP3155]